MDVWLHDSADRPDAGGSPRQPGLPGRGTHTGQSRLAYQLAAVVLILTSALAIILNVAAGAYLDPELGMEAWRNSIAIIIDVGLSIGLFQFRRGARTWVLLRAVLGTIFLSIRAWGGGDAVAWPLETAVALGAGGALVLFLTGESKTWRLVLAAVVFVAFTLIPLWAGIQLALLGRLLAL